MSFKTTNWIMKDDFYKQCRFTKMVGGLKMETVAYIPSWAAKEGNKVELKTLDGEVWTVLEAGDTEFSKEFIKETERGYKDFQKSLNGGGIDE